MLNSEQEKAIKYQNGPLLVIAGAGSGKTRVITHKIIYLIERCGIHPKQILALTFTNKAAREMAERVQAELKKNKSSLPRKGLQIATFHRLGLIFLKKEYAHLGLKSNFSLFDEYDSVMQLKEIALDTQSVTDEVFANIKQQISNWKNQGISADYAISSASDDKELTAARFYKAYQQRLNAYNAVDFDDLILLPVKLMTENAEVKEFWQNKFRYILVDEYQDTNENQYQLLKLLTGVRQAFTVVGDDDQAIYAWRGARVENLRILQQDFPNLEVIKLEQNYRSQNSILSAANHLIGHNPHLFDKKLWSSKGMGEKIRILVIPTESEEAERIVHDILAHKFRTNGQFGDYAILYRANHQSRIFEQVVRGLGITYHVSGGQSFFARTEIKDLLAYFRLIANPDDDSAFLRCVNVPRREIGPATLEGLSSYSKLRGISLFSACLEMGLKEHISEQAAQKLGHFSRMITDLIDSAESALPQEQYQILADFIDKIHYFIWLQETAPTEHAGLKRIENVQFFLQWFQKMLNKKLEEEEGEVIQTSETEKSSLMETINKMILLDILESQDKTKEDSLNLMTLHAAKGLEFKHVYLVGLEENVLPHKTSIETDNIEEERRLMYVGMTRAMDSLALSYTKERRNYGEKTDTEPSRFLNELPSEYIEWEGLNKGEEDPEKRTARGASHLANLRALLEAKGE